MNRSRFSWMLGAGFCIAIGAAGFRAWPWQQRNALSNEQAGSRMQKASGVIDRIMARAKAFPNDTLATLLRGSIEAPFRVSGSLPANVWFMQSAFAPLGTGASPAPDRIGCPAIILTGELLAAARSDAQAAAMLDALPANATELMELPVRLFRGEEQAVYHRNDVVAVVASNSSAPDVSGVLPVHQDASNMLTWYLCTADPAPGDHSPTPPPPGAESQNDAKPPAAKPNPDLWLALQDVAPKPAWDAATHYSAHELVQTLDADKPVPHLWVALDDNQGIDPRTDTAEHWRAMTHAVRIPLDRFGNPMILAPTGGLKSLNSVHQQTYDYAHPYKPGDQVIYKPQGRRHFWEEFWTCTGAPPTTGVPPTDKRYWLEGVSAPETTCFWASAGPDGEFLNADDNEYSFAK